MLLILSYWATDLLIITNTGSNGQQWKAALEKCADEAVRRFQLKGTVSYIYHLRTLQ